MNNGFKYLSTDKLIEKYIDKDKPCFASKSNEEILMLLTPDAIMKMALEEVLQILDKKLSELVKTVADAAKK